MFCILLQIEIAGSYRMPFFLHILTPFHTRNNLYTRSIPISQEGYINPIKTAYLLLVIEAPPPRVRLPIGVCKAK